METSSVVRLRAQSAWAQPVRGRARDRAGALARPRRVRCGRAVAMLQQHPPHPPPPPSVRTVTIPFSDLKERGKDLSGMIEEGLGPNGLGIISISDVPDFPVLRRTLLRLAPRVASLPEDVKKELEDPDSRYNFGWSHGKEKLESGKLDTFKGSYYANPILDVPTTNDVLVSRYPSYCRPNIWPADHLPELEIAFKALGKLMLEVGLMLAHHCDLYVMQQGVGPYDGESLEQTIARSRCHKGRLLYYFPRQFSKQKEEGRSVSSWCGWHTDHGSLTGLTCGLFTRNSVEIPCTDSAAGLYIQTRDNRVVKRLTNGYAFEKEGIICEVYTPGGDHGNRWRPAAGGISFSLFQFAIVAVINAKMNKKPPAFVNGFLHWLIDPALIIRRPRAAVISFSLEEETFRCVRSPPFWRSVVHTRSRTAGDHLVEMDNQLCMVRDLRNNPYGSSLEIWRLLDYSSGD